MRWYPLCVGDATVTLNTFMVHPVMGSPTVTNLSFSFTFGSVFNLNGSASAHSSALFDETAMTNAHLRIDAIEVLDSNGALITNYAVTTGSGANYAFVTPEPGTLTLVVGSLVALLVICRKSIDAHKRDDARGGSKAVPVDYDPRTENGARAESSTGALGEASEGRAEEG